MPSIVMLYYINHSTGKHWHTEWIFLSLISSILSHWITKTQTLHEYRKNLQITWPLPHNSQFPGKYLNRTCWTTCKIIMWFPIFQWWILKNYLIFKQIWHLNSTTATIIINHNPLSTKNNVKLISWSYYLTTDHTAFYQTGLKNSISHNTISIHVSFA
jgi:hypothetical protein